MPELAMATSRRIIKFHTRMVQGGGPKAQMAEESVEAASADGLFEIKLNYRSILSI
jgi:hypothetical protein